MLSWDDRDDFQKSPLETMRSRSASIVCLPVPIGSLSLPDHKLQANNPISLTGMLPIGLKEHVPSGDSEGHIGNFLSNGRSEGLCTELVDMWMRKRDSLEGVARLKFVARAPCPSIVRPATYQPMTGADWSDKLAGLWDFNKLNHDADYGTKQTFETASSLINTMCFHT